MERILTQCRFLPRSLLDRILLLVQAVCFSGPGLLTWPGKGSCLPGGISCICNIDTWQRWLQGTCCTACPVRDSCSCLTLRSGWFRSWPTCECDEKRLCSPGTPWPHNGYAVWARKICHRWCIGPMAVSVSDIERSDYFFHFTAKS